MSTARSPSQIYRRCGLTPPAPTAENLTVNERSRCDLIQCQSLGEDGRSNLIN